MYTIYYLFDDHGNYLRASSDYTSLIHNLIKQFNYHELRIEPRYQTTADRQIQSNGGRDAGTVTMPLIDVSKVVIDDKIYYVDKYLFNQYIPQGGLTEGGGDNHEN